MVIFVLGLVLFLGTHSVRMLAPEWRDKQLENLGKRSWQGIYSVISLTSLAILIYGYALAQPEAPIIYITPVWTRHLAFLLMAIAFISLMAGNLPPGRLKPALKHPMLMAVMIWAFAHLTVNGDLASIVLFGSILAWSIWNRISVSHRVEALPQPGPVTYDMAAIVLGLAIWVLFIWKLHEWLIGVPLVIA
ncbi:MAG: NnrU family protein [Pseudomonadota bacterium]